MPADLRPTFLGDSLWRDAPRQLSVGQAAYVGWQLQAELEADRRLRLRVPTLSYDDAQAIAVNVPRGNQERLLFYPAVSEAAGGGK